MQIIVSNEIEQVCPGFVGAAVEARVVNSQYSPELWQEIHMLEEIEIGRASCRERV